MHDPCSLDAFGMDHPAERNRLARWAGAFYLSYILLFATSTFLQSHLLAAGDPIEIARTLAGSMLLFRISFWLELVAALLFLLAAWACAALFRPAGRNLASLLLLLNLAGVITECISTSMRFGVLQIAARETFANAMPIYRACGESMTAATLFYGAWLFPLGILVYRSRLIPRFWGVLLIADGAAMTICFVQICLFPELRKWTYPLYPVMFLAETGTALWLLIKGVRNNDLPDDALEETGSAASE